jgi:hypothetical protein
MTKKIIKGNSLQQDPAKETGSSRPEDAGEGFGGKSEDKDLDPVEKNIRMSGKSKEEIKKNKR